MLRRREFLATLSCAPLAAGASGYEPVVAAQAYVFSQVYALHDQKIEDHYSEVLETLKGAGFHTVELVSQFFAPDVASNNAQSLMLSRLKCPIVYNSGVLHTADGAKTTMQETLALVKRVKASGPLDLLNFNANPKPNKEPKTDAELALQAENLNKLAKDLKKMGVRLMLHQHDAEMAQDAREWRQMLKTTDPKLVEICLDVHWVLRGGQDPMTLLKEAAPRLAALHLRNSKKGVWTEAFGEGDIDYTAVAAFLKQGGFKGYLVVELAYDKQTEMTLSLEANLRSSREYAEKVFDVKA
ncbi:TIM barrel protein [uncultured Paludibaculum sp.]|uniref:sugar phosphate isomerase/epimerase family protein n=1 Tax=uncultured Paludibaculum sp. TaxID=1765020 RepID=UPI002AABF2D9|nr:TIM barrel protein [uncultured Paludibaculum sp.]